MKIQTNPHTLNMIDPERDLAFRPNAASNSWFVVGYCPNQGRQIRGADGSQAKFVGHRPGTEIHWQANRHLVSG